MSRWESWLVAGLLVLLAGCQATGQKRMNMEGVTMKTTEEVPEQYLGTGGQIEYWRGFRDAVQYAKDRGRPYTRKVMDDWSRYAGGVYLLMKGLDGDVQGTTTSRRQLYEAVRALGAEDRKHVAGLMRDNEAKAARTVKARGCGRCDWASAQYQEHADWWDELTDSNSGASMSTKWSAEQSTGSKHVQWDGTTASMRAIGASYGGRTQVELMGEDILCVKRPIDQFKMCFELFDQVPLQ